MLELRNSCTDLYLLPWNRLTAHLLCSLLLPAHPDRGGARLEEGEAGRSLPRHRGQITHQRERVHHSLLDTIQPAVAACRTMGYQLTGPLTAPLPGARGPSSFITTMDPAVRSVLPSCGAALTYSTAVMVKRCDVVQPRKQCTVNVHFGEIK